MKTEWTRKNLSIAGGIVVSSLLILPNLGKGWEALKYVLDSFPTAYAAKTVAGDVRSDFDRYIAQQEEALKLEKQRNELQEDYNKKLLDIQQQQAPNQVYRPQAPQPVPQPIPPIPAPPTTIQVQRFQDTYGRWYCWDGVESTWANEQGACE